MKKAVVIILAVLLFAGLAMGAASTEATRAGEDSMKIGFAMYNVSEFTVLMRTGIEAECADRDAELVTLDAGYDAATQIDQVENLVMQGCDAIVLAPVDADALVPALDIAAEGGVPIVIVNCALNTDAPYYYVGPDDVAAGEIEAQYLIDTIGEEGNILIFKCKLGTSYEIQRAEGIYNVLDQYPGINVLAVDSANGNRDEAVDLMENWLEAYASDLDGIISQNDGMAMGAISVLQAAGYGDIPVIGVDAIEDALVAIANGEMLGTVYQDGDLEGREAVKMAFDLINGDEPENPTYLIEMTLVTQDNAADLLKEVYGVEL